MKKSLVFAVLAAVMMLTAIAFAQRHNLNGTWYMGGPYNVGKPCKIIQQGNDLTFINEGGDRSTGNFNADGTVVATSWGNLQAEIVNGGNRINWKNNTWWVRHQKLDLNGTWYMGGPYNVGKPCKIIQQGNDLTFINEGGDRSTGNFNADGTVVATSWGNLQGVLDDRNKRINWANKTWWYRK